MKQDFTSITVLIDASGSMEPLAKETISGFNDFLKEQQALPGEAVLSLATFSYAEKYKLVYDCVPLAEVAPLNSKIYTPAGGTALLDAIGRTVNTLGMRLSAMKEEERPSKVLFLIMTDGEENASKEFFHEKVMEMINHQREKYSWEFVFLGANQDAIKGGTSLGVAATHSYNFNSTSVGTKQVYASVTRGVSDYRLSSVGSTFSMPDPTNTADPVTTTPIVTVDTPVVTATTPDQVTIPGIAPKSKTVAKTITKIFGKKTKSRK